MHTQPPLGVALLPSRSNPPADQLMWRALHVDMFPSVTPPAARTHLR